MLQALGELPDPQTGLLLLRHCAAYSRMVFAMRVTPPQLLGEAASDFDSAVRDCLERFCTGPLSAEAWLQASLSTAAGGLGLRRQAFCCCLRSLPHCSTAPAWTRTTQVPGLWLPLTLSFSTSLFCLPTMSRSLRRPLCDNNPCRWRWIVTPGAGREAFRANLQLQRQLRAGAWLHAVPCEALALFRVLVKLRLRIPVATADVACPLCDGVADRFGDHALSCPCGGDRTQRHNRLRSVLAARTQAAGPHPEWKKTGLLPPRSGQDGLPVDGALDRNGRRPADVYLFNWGVHGPAAFHLAVTAGLLQGSLHTLLSGADKPAADHEANKRSHLRTQDLCTEQGIQFVRLVVESRGGWGPTAIKSWQTLAAATAACSGEAVATEANRLYETLAVALQRENARAVPDLS